MSLNCNRCGAFLPDKPGHIVCMKCGNRDIGWNCPDCSSYCGLDDEFCSYCGCKQPSDEVILIVDKVGYVVADPVYEDKMRKIEQLLQDENMEPKWLRTPRNEWQNKVIEHHPDMKLLLKEMSK